MIGHDAGVAYLGVDVAVRLLYESLDYSIIHPELKRVFIRDVLNDDREQNLHRLAHDVT